MDEPARNNDPIAHQVPFAEELGDNNQNASALTLVRSTMDKKPFVTFSGRIKGPAGFRKDVHPSSLAFGP